jgi:hypothetical protein
MVICLIGIAAVGHFVGRKASESSGQYGHLLIDDSDPIKWVSVIEHLPYAEMDRLTGLILANTPINKIWNFSNVSGQICSDVFDQLLKPVNLEPKKRAILFKKSVAGVNGSH